MSSVRAQPLLCVRDVKASSRWYQQVLGVKGGHGGDEYEMLMSDGQLVMQLHCFEEEHHHGSMGDPSKLLGNGVAVWFHVDDLDGVVARSKAAGAVVQTDVHVNPNAQHRELWLRDPDGYLVVVAGK
jgi:catechol 2,3-dioxygenase-like lactoylglutathione lyase family enzyme